MKSRRWLYVVLCASVACSFDLVDPAPGRRDTRLFVSLDATDPAMGTVVVSGFLRPAIDDGGEEVQVADPELVLSGTRLRPDSVYEEGRLALFWTDTVAAPWPASGDMRLVSPRMADGSRLDELALPLRRAVADGVAPGEWRAGEDILLPMTPTPVDEVEAASAQWQLAVHGWLESGARLILLSTHAFTTIPDTIRILGAWLPHESVDSLEVSVTYDRDFRSATADSAYTGWVRLAQRFQWRLRTVGP